MNTRLLDTAEAMVVGGGTIFALSNITTWLGILILCMNLFLIGYKIYVAIKKSKESGNTEELEDEIQHSIDLLQDYINKRDKEESHGGKDTSKE